MALLVHGIVRADAISGEDISDGEGVEIVAHGEIAALASTTAEAEVMPSRANLLRHTGVLDSALGMTTVLPMRFGMVVPDGDALVTSFLDPEQDTLLETIDRLDGHVEMRLRGRYVEEAVLRVVLASDRRAQRLRGREGMQARMELGERMVEGIEALRDRHLELIVGTLGSHAAGVAPTPVAEPLDAFAVSFLVDRAEMETFDQEVEEIASALDPIVEVELIGPLPPFSFAGTGEG